MKNPIAFIAFAIIASHAVAAGTLPASAYEITLDQLEGDQVKVTMPANPTTIKEGEMFSGRGPVRLRYRAGDNDQVIAPACEVASDFTSATCIMPDKPHVRFHGVSVHSADGWTVTTDRNNIILTKTAAQ